MILGRQDEDQIGLFQLLVRVPRPADEQVRRQLQRGRRRGLHLFRSRWFRPIEPLGKAHAGGRGEQRHGRGAKPRQQTLAARRRFHSRPVVAVRAFIRRVIRHRPRPFFLQVRGPPSRATSHESIRHLDFNREPGSVSDRRKSLETALARSLTAAARNTTSEADSYFTTAVPSAGMRRLRDPLPFVFT